jgi:hypothetical protein
MDPAEYAIRVVRTNEEHLEFTVHKGEPSALPDRTPGGKSIRYTASTQIRLKMRAQAQARSYKTAWDHLLCDDLD